MSEDLKKRAQELLAKANRLIKEAGELAKEGQFTLHFGEIGDFIPKSLVSLRGWREKALEELKAEGRYNGGEWDEAGKEYVDRPRTPFEELTADEVREYVEGLAEDMRADCGIPWQFLEYADEGDGDIWWHPSRC